MSLVYEALQKAAQENKRFAAQPLPPVAPPPPAAPAPVPVARPRSPSIWITGLSLVAFAVVVVAVIVVARRPALPAATVASAPPVTAAPPAPVTAVPATAAPSSADTTANDPRFKLTGIMQLGTEYSAVINGHVVSLAQYVDGAIVKAVERDRVTLNVDGRNVVLRLF